MNATAANPPQPAADPTASGPIAAARRYPRPSTDCQAAGGGSLPTAEEINAFGAWLGPPGWWTAPRTLGVIGIAVSPLLNPLALILGLIGHYKAKKAGQSPRLPKIAWILSIAFPIFGFATNACARNMFSLHGFY